MNAALWETLLHDIDARLMSRGLRPSVRAGRVAEDLLRDLEQKLGVILPEDYRSFLREFGALELGGSSIFGIWSDDPDSEAGGTILGETLRLREAGLPPELIPIQACGYSQHLCLGGPRLQYFSSAEQALFPLQEAGGSFAEYLTKFLLSSSS